MEKRHVRFEDPQDALLWLMANRTDKLYDPSGDYVMHGAGNTIEYYELIPIPTLDDPDAELATYEEDLDIIDYEEFLKMFKNVPLENKINE